MSARLLLIALFLCAACKKSQNLCTSDTQCKSGFFCDPSTGACRCQSDATCGAASMCNAAGFCQPRLRCDSTADCADGSICDTVSGVCIPQGACSSLDVQCKAGQVCKDFSCVPGCAHNGDCPAPADVCRACPAGTPASACPTGSRCVRGHCDSQLTCHYGDLCAPDGTGDKVCTPDARGPYCQPCARTAGTAWYCEGPGNYCLIDASRPLGQAFYCGVNCVPATPGGPDLPCPFGYTCRDVRIVRAQNCDPNAGLSACAAVASGVNCDPAKNHAGTAGGIVNDDCDNASLIGAVCDPNSRKCVPQCLGTGETGVQAFCSCLQNSDCPQDSCDSATRACVISGKPCIVGGTDCDNAIRCVKSTDPRLGAVGYCRIGRNCAPSQGYTCSTLLSQ
jgi:hypothetical protein